MFVYHRGEDMVVLLLYMDDIILTASSTSLLSSIITYLQQEFAISDLSNLHYFPGISVTRSSSGIFIS